MTTSVTPPANTLPTGAATESTLAGIKTGTDKIPAAPSQEHTTAASPNAARLTDGTAFYKATTPADTQPVSAAALPLPTGAATESTLGGVLKEGSDITGASMPVGGASGRGWLSAIWKALTDRLPSALVGGRLDVNVGNTVGVTGTFWQLTQPVSGPLTDTQLRATAVPVSGTFFQATQPVSGSVSLTGALPAGTNAIGTVAQATLTKGTQGATGVSTQDLKDAGRTLVNLYAEAVAGATAEALITLTQSKGLAASTTGTDYLVATGKTLRIQQLAISFVATTTTANTARIRIRASNTGAVSLLSPLVWSMRQGWESSTFITNEVETTVLDFPDGFELPAGYRIGFTHLEAAANGTIDLALIGYEY